MLNDTGRSAAERANGRLSHCAALIFSVALVLLLGQAFIPVSEFIHRSDDAFYYFGVAVNYPESGFWTFDGVTPTNGVQPLWAVLLSGFAQFLSWFGLEDRHVLARIFVGVTALAHFGSVVLLYRLLSHRVAISVAIAAAGGLLLPMGLVWARAWGLENSLYALLLTGTVLYYDTVFRERAHWKGALALGILLGLTALARLNAGFLIPILLGAMLLDRCSGTPRDRFRLAVVAGASAALVLTPFLVVNLVYTGHILPISGAVKSVGVDHLFEARGIDSVFSLAFLKYLYWHNLDHVVWFITSRGLDGLWAVGARLVFPGSTTLGSLGLLVLALLAFPLLLGQPGEWLRRLGSRFRSLGRFWYVGVFGVLNAVVSVALYPTQLSYAMIRWWFVENELVVIVVFATLAGCFVEYVGGRLIPAKRRLAAVTLLLCAMVVYHGQEFIRFYWDGEKQNRDWNLSWNDESYLAARWISESLPPDTLVGSWNAGVLGYYAERPVVNLDGLINNFDLVPYLRKRNVAAYIRDREIEYLSDLEPMFKSSNIREELELSPVYSNHSEFMGSDYRIYRVEP